MTKDKVLVANGQGFWGDSILGPVRLVEEGPLDYLTLDYLAEVTMSIMQKLRSRKPDTGYATDFVRLVDRILPTLVEKDVRDRGGRMLLVETSLLPHYESTRRFYFKYGYSAVAQIADYYAEGDGLIVFAKRFNVPEPVVAVAHSSDT